MNEAVALITGASSVNHAVEAYGRLDYVPRPALGVEMAERS